MNTQNTIVTLEKPSIQWDNINIGRFGLVSADTDNATGHGINSGLDKICVALRQKQLAASIVDDLVSVECFGSTFKFPISLAIEELMLQLYRSPETMEQTLTAMSIGYLSTAQMRYQLRDRPESLLDKYPDLTTVGFTDIQKTKGSKLLTLIHPALDADILKTLEGSFKLHGLVYDQSNPFAPSVIGVKVEELKTE